MLVRLLKHFPRVSFLTKFQPITLLSIRKMSDDNYMKMLNSNNNFEFKETTDSISNKNDKFSDIKEAKWLNGLLKKEKEISVSNEDDLGLKNILGYLTKVSNGVTYYSEADFEFEKFSLLNLRLNQLPTEIEFLKLVKEKAGNETENLEQFDVKKQSLQQFIDKSTEDEELTELFDKLKEMSSEENLEIAVYTLNDKQSVYSYHFISMLIKEEEAIVGLVTLEVQS
ncbi:hypothetical protein K502DRAFT_177352 [Neoconidiobolus thromboides FSU 785]|nr:hypothetical protein K502DRAFT_177352 [Neoconidiobolus thromboides FSU 785]